MFNLDSALGIEVIGDNLFFAVVRKKYQSYSVQGSLIIKNYSDLPETELYGRIQHFINQNSFNRENVILGVPRSQVIVRYITLPQEVEENLDQVAKIQFRKYEPNEEISSHLDYQIVERNEKTGRITLRVSMVGREYMDNYLALFKRWNLYPYAVRISSTGLVYSLAVHRDGLLRKDPVLIFRISDEIVEALMLLENLEFYSEVFYREAEDEITADWLMTETTSLISRITKKIKQIDKVYVTGKVPEGIFEELSRRLGQVVHLANGIDSSEWNIKKEEKEELLVAAGLGLSGLEKSGRKRLNLIPPAQRLIGGTPSLAATAALVFLLIVTGLGWITQGYFQEKRLLAQMDDQIRVMNREVDEVFRIRDEVERKKAELDLLKSLMSDRQIPLMLLKELSERIPEDTYFRTFKISGNEVEIQGSGARASGLVPIIADSPYLDAVKINWIRADSRDAGRERFSFSANIEGIEEGAE